MRDADESVLVTSGHCTVVHTLACENAARPKSGCVSGAERNPAERAGGTCGAQSFTRRLFWLLSGS